MLLDLESLKKQKNESDQSFYAQTNLAKTLGTS